MTRRHLAAPLALLVALACDSDAPTVPEAPLGDPGDAGSVESTVAPASVVCPNCIFDPVLYDRASGAPQTEVVEFEGHPDGAYVLETDDLGTPGAESRIWLNGARIRPGRGLESRDVVLGPENVLRVRLTGKPGSKLRVRIYQEVARVEVGPATARDRYHARRQFTAVARDRNGVEIPRQTFTWESDAPTIAVVDSMGEATTVGPSYDAKAWSYKRTSTGVGDATIVARADGTPDKQGTASWTVVAGFVYVVFQAPHPDASVRPEPVPFHYEELRLNRMAVTCAREASNEEWWDYQAGTERLFRQCYTSWEQQNLVREWIPPTPLTDGFYAYSSVPNVGLYGRYCGAGHPDQDWYDQHAAKGDYEPKDAIDALCMEHDRQEAHHALTPGEDDREAACIVRWGIESELLYEGGALVPPGSARWNAFWSSWPAMKEARDNWLTETSLACFGRVYSRFKEDRRID